MRLVIADDSWLMREGLVRLLTELGHVVVGQSGDADQVPALVAAHDPDVVVLDIKMPPTGTDEGLRLATALREAHPGLPILLLSQYVEASFAATLLTLTGTRRCGYLVKDHVLDAAQLQDALQRLASGEVVIDPAVVRLLLDSPRVRDPLATLTRREREVLALMAEGRSNRGIATHLYVSLDTVGSHVQHVMTKLGIPDDTGDNRRVLTVLSYLNAGNHRV
jgi:DNA-binding NarL/FixJ family response regulator